MAERTPRTETTREGSERRKGWQRQSLLPVPEPRDGLKFRWVRTSTLGQEDNKNVSSRFREGYTPVIAKDFPELMVMSDHNSRFRDNVEVGGLLLCSIPMSSLKSVSKVSLKSPRLRWTPWITATSERATHGCLFYVQNGHQRLRTLASDCLK